MPHGIQYVLKLKKTMKNFAAEMQLSIILKLIVTPPQSLKFSSMQDMNHNSYGWFMAQKSSDKPDLTSIYLMRNVMRSLSSIMLEQITMETQDNNGKDSTTCLIDSKEKATPIEIASEWI